MILPVIKYGHPVLRKKGARIEQITPAIRTLIRDMLETMHHASGVGLAAQQIGESIQLAVIDVTVAQERPSTLEMDGQQARVEDFMPLILINPEVTLVGNPVSGPEGCLSFPDIFAEIARAETADVRTLNEAGKLIQFRCGGLLARAVQHETDHLNGILFIDRMETAEKRGLKPELDALTAETKAALKG